MRASYVPRTTQGCDAVAIVREHWPAFRERVEMHVGPLRGFMCDEIEAFATCGEFERGFLVAECLGRVPRKPAFLSWAHVVVRASKSARPVASLVSADA